MVEKRTAAQRRAIDMYKEARRVLERVLKSGTVAEGGAKAGSDSELRAALYDRSIWRSTLGWHGINVAEIDREYEQERREEGQE